MICMRSEVVVLEAFSHYDWPGFSLEIEDAMNRQCLDRPMSNHSQLRKTWN